MESTQLLGLTFEQTLLLFRLQNYIINEDIKHELDTTKQTHKISWRNKWQYEMKLFLKSIDNRTTNNYINTNIYINADINLMKTQVQKIRSELKNINTPLYLILLESVLFIPYYAFANISTDEQKKYSSLKLNTDTKNNSLRMVSIILNISNSYIQKFQDSYKSAENNLTGFWGKVLLGTLIGTVLFVITAGLAAPLIAPLFAAAGLSGAAAFSAGLAAIGGGAIAAGGLGIAGGIAVIVGGGAILGGTMGSIAGGLMATSPDFTLSQAAKLEVVMKEIILGTQKDIRFAQEIISQQRKSIQEAEKALDELKMQVDGDKKRIKNLTKSIEYLKKALKQNMQYAKEAA